jgi:hypothetical protein
MNSFHTTPLDLAGLLEERHFDAMSRLSNEKRAEVDKVVGHLQKMLNDEIDPQATTELVKEGIACDYNMEIGEKFIRFRTVIDLEPLDLSLDQQTNLDQGEPHG